MLERKIAFGQHTLTISSGLIARQAHGAVLVNLDDTVVLVTVVGEKRSGVIRNFLPLSVHYQERSYAAGKIPGGYFKREGRPSEQETLIARLIDRPLRPLFPKNFYQETQVTATVLSLNPQVLPDIPAMIGASAALVFSGLPFQGPIGAIRVGYKDGIYIPNPSRQELSTSALDLVVAGTRDHVLMVESEAKELSEQVMLGAVLYGHEMLQSVIDVIEEMKQSLKVEPWPWEPPVQDVEILERLKNEFTHEIQSAYAISDKTERQHRLAELKEFCLQQLAPEKDEVTVNTLTEGFFEIEKNWVRTNVLKGQPRIDGRDIKTVRDITIHTGILPRVHGSSLFTRGETQALVAATLGTEKDVQIIDALEGERKERFMLHYNFPPYSVGEIGAPLGPKRREIGHGNLARRAIEAVLPTEKAFPYVIRVVSEITESNGSSSMATVCGASLALMDAGVPIKAPVSGVAMGLIKQGDEFVVLTDILGDEDHLGDMDFKVAGTVTGITALQMDIKIAGITKNIMSQALEQARIGRMHILKIMNGHLDQHRDVISIHAPRIYTMHIPTDKIKDVIGKGGTTIRQLTEETGVTIDINDSGQLKIFAVNEADAFKAQDKIKQLTSDVQVGSLYEGVVMRIVDFGAFVSVLPNKEGLLHISQISDKRINKVADVLAVGQKIRVKILEVDKQGRVKLTMRNLEEELGVLDEA